MVDVIDVMDGGVYIVGAIFLLNLEKISFTGTHAVKIKTPLYKRDSYKNYLISQ